MIAINKSAKKRCPNNTFHPGEYPVAAAEMFSDSP
jgi:hypothetical protein